MHGQETAYPTMRDIRYDNGFSSMATPSLPPNFQRVADNADAATPFGTHNRMTGGLLLGSTDFVADGRSAMLYPSSPPGPTRGPVPRSYQSLYQSQPILSTQTNATMNFGAPTVRGPPEAERSFFPRRSDQNRFPHITPRITSDNPPHQATNRPPPTSLLAPAPPCSPSSPSATSPASVVRCSEPGCQVEFTGHTWKDSLRRHKLHYHKHSDKSKPTCPICDKRFPSGRPDNVKRHIIRKHADHPLIASLNIRNKKSAPKRRRR